MASPTGIPASLCCTPRRAQCHPAAERRGRNPDIFEHDRDHPRQSGSAAVLAALLSTDAIVAAPNFNRWKMPVVAVAIHVCIGSVYSWSIFNPALVRELGVAASAADDWSVNSVAWVFSVAIAFVGVAAVASSRWLPVVGPRVVGLAAACLWGGGFVVAGVGISLHQQWLVYLGYGALGGCGLGLGYICPVAALMQWFPYRRGMATGMAIMGFGGGAVVAVPLKEFLLRFYYEAPEYLGAVDAVSLTTERGRRFASGAGQMVESVVVDAVDVSQMLVPGNAGVYAVGTGDTGAAKTFLTLGVLYFVVMAVSAWAIRVPPEGWKPADWQAMEKRQKRGWGTRPAADVHVNRVLKTSQFYLLWTILCFNVTAGIAIISVAKTMMSDIFGSSLPDIATPAFATTYVLMISVFNMIGRFFWSSTSDYIGRKRTYACFFALGPVLYLCIALTGAQMSTDPATVWLVVFYTATMIVFTMFGGGFAAIPAYISDVFGTMHASAIHGRLLTAWSTAGILGPALVGRLRESSIERAIRDLASKADPAAYLEKFGAPVDSLDELIETKTVTIAKLMELAPAGTPDPTSSLYNTTMYIMAGLLAIAFAVNLMIRPAAPEHHHANTNPQPGSPQRNA